MPIVQCCKCFHRTRKSACTICFHQVCSSCNPVQRHNPRVVPSGLEPEQVSDTPRSDAAAKDGWSGDAVCTSFEFTQGLERENTKLFREVQRLKSEGARLRARLVAAKG